MKVLVTRRSALRVVGMQITTTVEENKIAELWNEFISRMPELDEVAVPDCSLGICCPVVGAENGEFEYMAARVVKDDSVVPEGMVFKILPERDVAVFTHEGTVENLSETYDYIYNEWLPAHDFEVDIAEEVEWYDSRYKYDDPHSEMDIHIPLRDQDGEVEIDDIFTNMLTEE